MARRGNQNRIITFRLTPGRHKMLQRWADEARLDVSEFVRRLLEVEEARRQAVQSVTAPTTTEQAA